MNVNIYYGGRGLVDDPTITVLNKITDVLNELRLNVEKYNLFEMKNDYNASSDLKGGRCGYSCKYGRMVWDRRLYASVP